MPLPYQPWRAAYQPASFGGAEFKVEIDSKAGGRRNQTHEFPHRDKPWTEDLGRKAHRWSIVAYVVGPDYLKAAAALEKACDAEGPQTLVQPLMGSVRVNLDDWARTERRELGGYAIFEMRLSEAGSPPDSGVTADTQSQATSAADTSDTTAAASADESLGSGDPTAGRYSTALDGSATGDPTPGR